MLNSLNLIILFTWCLTNQLIKSSFRLLSVTYSFFIIHADLIIRTIFRAFHLWLTICLFNQRGNYKVLSSLCFSKRLFLHWCFRIWKFKARIACCNASMHWSQHWSCWAFFFLVFMKWFWYAFCHKKWVADVF